MPKATVAVADKSEAVCGAGLGLRRALLDDLLAMPDGAVDFLELAPENWLGVGGRYRRKLDALLARYPLVLHGLSLDIGGPRPLDTELLDGIRWFMDRYHCSLYTEHLTACADEGHLYDLMPIPFTDEAVDYVAARVRAVQEQLGRRIALENASYYAAPGQHMSEADFIRAVVTEADCDLLLDVNNVYVNSINHGYDPYAFIAAMPAERVVYLHIAGHYVEAEDLRVDTHGADVIDPVWALLDAAYAHCGVQPTLLERDFNFPPFSVLLREVEAIRSHQARAGADAVAGVAG